MQDTQEKNKIASLQKELEITQGIQGIRASIAQGAANRAARVRATGIRAAQAELANLESSPNLAGQRAILEARQKLADLVLENEQATLDEQKRIAKQEQLDALALLAKREEILSLEMDLNKTALERAERDKDTQIDLLKTRFRLEALRRGAEGLAIEGRRSVAAQERIITELQPKPKKKNLNSIILISKDRSLH